MTQKFAAAPLSLFGYGCRKEIIPILKREKVKKALIITDPTLAKIGVLEQVSEVLKQSNMEYAIYSGVCPNPTLKNVMEGLNAYHANDCDYLIAVGGGSSNDCAKAIRVTISNKNDLKEYQGGNKSEVRGPFLVAINTTAGTASEVSRAYLITDEDSKRKLIFKDDFVMPDLAVNDVELMVGLPASITAQTGMDALTHAIESVCSTTANQLTNIYAHNAIELIETHLRTAVTHPDNLEAREGMALGQYLAGLSFGNAGLGLVHAMAHQLGGTYNLPHGLCNAILLPVVLEYFRTDCADTLSQIAEWIVPEACADHLNIDKADILIKHISDLSREIGTLIPLCELGVTAESLDEMSHKALEDGCIFSSPIIPNVDQVKTLYEKVLK